MDGQCGSSCSEARTGAGMLYANPRATAKGSGPARPNRCCQKAPVGPSGAARPVIGGRVT